MRSVVCVRMLVNACGVKECVLLLLLLLLLRVVSLCSKGFNDPVVLVDGRTGNFRGAGHSAISLNDDERQRHNAGLIDTLFNDHFCEGLIHARTGLRRR